MPFQGFVNEHYGSTLVSICIVSELATRSVRKQAWRAHHALSHPPRALPSPSGQAQVIRWCLATALAPPGMSRAPADVHYPVPHPCQPPATLLLVDSASPQEPFAFATVPRPSLQTHGGLIHMQPIAAHAHKIGALDSSTRTQMAMSGLGAGAYGCSAAWHARSGPQCAAAHKPPPTTA